MHPRSHTSHWTTFLLAIILNLFPHLIFGNCISASMQLFAPLLLKPGCGACWRQPLHHVNWCQHMPCLPSAALSFPSSSEKNPKSLLRCPRPSMVWPIGSLTSSLPTALRFSAHEPFGLFADLCSYQIYSHFWPFALAVSSHQKALSWDTCMANPLISSHKSPS